MTDPTPLDHARTLLALAEKATPGPWASACIEPSIAAGGGCGRVAFWTNLGPKTVTVDRSTLIVGEDMDYIAYSRNHAPSIAQALIAECERADRAYSFLFALYQHPGFLSSCQQLKPKLKQLLLHEEIAQLRTDLARVTEERDRLRAAMRDLVSWIPSEATTPKWQLKAGEYGADDAIQHARQLLEAK